MSYNLKKDKTIKNLTYFSYHFEGLTINTKNHKRKNMIKVNKMVLTDDEIINAFKGALIRLNQLLDDEEACLSIIYE